MLNTSCILRMRVRGVRKGVCRSEKTRSVNLYKRKVFFLVEEIWQGSMAMVVVAFVVVVVVEAFRAGW